MPRSHYILCTQPRYTSIFAKQAAIDHYHAEIDGLLAAGIVPMVTLLHFTHPLWLEERGGFEDDGAPAAFLTFARKMYQEYGGKVRSGGGRARKAKKLFCLNFRLIPFLFEVCTLAQANGKVSNIVL